MADDALEEGKLCRRCAEVALQEYRYCPRCGNNTWTPLSQSIVGQTDITANGVGQLHWAPWTAADVAKGIALFVAQAVVVSLLFILIFTLIDSDNVGLYALLVTFLVETLLVAVVWLFAVSKYHISWRAVGLWRRPTGKGVLLAVGVVIAGVVVQGVYLNLLEWLGVDTENATPSTFIDEEDIIVLVLLSLLALLVAPVAEELFFRGFVFGGLANRIGFWRGAALSAAVFSLAHIEPIKLFPMFILGLLFAWLYYKTGSLWSSVMAHFFNNALALGVLLV